MEAQAMVEIPQLKKSEKIIQESGCCPGGTVFKTKMVCGCCFCESKSCVCEWHLEASGFWS